MAQPAPSSAAAADLSAQATQLYNEGAAAAKLGQWDKARTFYLSAWRVQQHWQIAASLGRAELKAGKLRDAAEHLTYFLHEAPKGKIEPDDRKKTEELLEQAKTKVGMLALSVNQVGAEIRVDMTPAGKAPLKEDVFVEPGRHVVEARLEGYGPVQATVEVQAGGEVPVDLRLVKVEVPKPLPGPLGPPGPPGPGAGTDSGPNKTVVLAGAVAAGVAALAGAGFAIGAKLKLNERGEEKTSCTSQSECDRYNSAEVASANLAVASLTSFIAAGVLGGGTVTYYVLKKQAAKLQSTAKVDLLLYPGTVGATITVPW